jgi:hypothetical protein
VVEGAGAVVTAVALAGVVVTGTVVVGAVVVGATGATPFKETEIV